MTKRTGPHPLFLHLNAGAALISVAAGEKDMFHGSKRLLQKAMDGVSYYHQSSVKPYYRDMQVVSKTKGSQILKPKGSTCKDCVILIPSLINSWHIFDIEQEHSFVAYLNKNDLVPFIVEWAQPITNITMNDYITEHLAPLIRGLIEQGYVIKGLIGYCMGATFIPALYSAFPKIAKYIGKTILIAPPWDFSYQTFEQTARLQGLALQTYGMGHIVPNDYIQSLFWAVDPLQVFKKFQKFPNVSNPDRFVRVEDWLNEGRAVSKSVIQTCLFDWYRDNKITKGTWVINDTIVSMKSLSDKTLVIVGKKDNLVPMASAQSLLDNFENIVGDTGHIGLMASDKSIDTVWKPIVEFLKTDKIPERKKL